MKKLVFKLIFLASLFLPFYKSVHAQKLKFLIPDGVIVQHAGSIGYFSGGINYNLFKRKKGNLDILYGFVPADKGGAFSTLSTKFSFQPFEIRINKWITLFPVSPGAFLNYMIGNDFDLTWSNEQYPGGYYYWSEALRAHISISNEVKFHSKKSSEKKLQSLALYYEINTNDAYLVNYVQNSGTISLSDIFFGGFGLRVKF